MQRLIVFVFFVFSRVLISAQSTTVVATLPNVMLPSPQAMQLLKFDGYPVNFSTGLPQINIPIYEIKSTKLNLPININYHAAGYKPKELSGLIGLGWNLIAGGRITRITMGQADELTPFINPNKLANTIPTSYVSSSLSDFDYLNRVINGTTDAEYDIFSYNAGSLSGRFVLKDNNGLKTPVSFPFKPVKIGFNSYTTLNPGIKYFDIYDEEGTHYRFGTSLVTNEDNSEETTNWSRYEGAPPLNNYNINTSGWLLSEIISADQTDTIQFKYQDGGRPSTQNISYSFSVEDNLQPTFNCANWDNCRTTYSSVGIYNEVGVKNVEEIIFKSGRLVFSYEHAGGPALGDKLVSIKLYNQNNQLSRSFDFTQNFFPLDNTRYKLDALNIKDASLNIIEPYQFTYNETPNSVVSTSTMSLDYWDFYNGVTNGNLYPSTWLYSCNFGTQTQIGTANREANEAAMKTNQLKKIKFPTGGFTEFTFESNKCDYPGLGIINVGGLRITDITSNDGNGNKVIKTYKYGVNESGTGKLLQNPYNIFNFSYVTRSGYYCLPDAGNWYDRKQVYSTSFIDGSSIFNLAPVVYENISEYQGSIAVNSGKTVYTYSPLFLGTYSVETNTGIPSSLPTLRSYIQNITGFDEQTLSQKDIYKNNNNPNDPYKLIATEVYTYQDFPKETLHGLKTFRGIEVQNSPGGGEQRADYRPFQALCPMFVCGDIYLSTKAKKLKKQENYLYDNNGSTLLTTTDFTYANLNHLYPTQITTTTSNNAEQIINNQKYVLDYSITGTPTNTTASGIQNLQSLNMVSPVIEKYIQKSNIDGSNVRTLTGVLNTYKSSVPYPDLIYQLEVAAPITNFLPTIINSTSFTKNSNYQPKLSFDNYNKGNISEQHKISDLSHSYIWDYNDRWPIAEAVSASQADIAYTSFEADGTGNWSYVGIPTIDYNPVTGDKSYDLSSGQITKTVDATKTYIVTYWSRSGVQTVKKNGTNVPVAVTGINVKGWTIYTYRISGGSSGTATVTISGSGVIDELRLYPLGAQMTTYAFDPLVGMTSQCSINNTVTYYEYDDFGRLKLVRDKNRNVLKKYCYNYTGQTESCSLPAATVPIKYTNNLAITGFTAKYTHASTGVVTTFNVPASGTSQPLGSILSGVYNLTISKTGNNTQYMFGSGCTNMTTDGTSATFYNVSVNLSNCNQISLSTVIP